MAPRAMGTSSIPEQKLQQLEKAVAAMEMAKASSSITSTRESSSYSIAKEKEGIHGDDDNKGCCTPKGKRHRIPELLSCPPPPKKRKVATSSCTFNKRSPIAFFSPPDLDLFFFFAFRNSSC
ncbi:cyclin-dependent protein kinase inhibitor SMR9-like [Humulus lupulus]|uniref:cyclin-dependent protein kinase inhibitor SMR9-like n=1 Tax=Humulus lupulus TaxID=3486 RepID=UPI002B407FEF|nr:cyclin-dependent protein kinase inhibitor SMR9-like [Humulus lupulus]